MWGETIEVTALHGGLGLANADALRRLRELGFKRTQGKGGIGSAPRGESQAEFLAGFPKIRDLDHYREIISDPRSKGPLVAVDRGVTITMERTSHPWKKDKTWYVILDTAIGCDVGFLQELRRRRKVKVVTVEQHST